MKGLVEISSKTAVAGKTPVKFVLHQIYNDPSEYNLNGISWNRQNTENCMYSIKNMPIVCQFADDDKSIPFGGHGEMTKKDGNIVFEDSLVVGSFEDAYIDDDIEVNGVKISGLIGNGFIYNQRFPCLVDYLQEQYDNKSPVESSVEICADKSKGNSKIIYEDGWKEKGRVPKEYQYSGQALCIGVEAADNTAIMVELNNKQKEGSKMPDKTVEINELTYWDLTCLISRAFNKAMNDDDRYRYFYIYALYPASSRVIMQDDSKIPAVYYLSVYTITGNKVTLSEITEVEADWKPVDSEQAAEINTKAINLKLKESFEMTDEKLIEMNQKIDDSTKTINTLTTKNVELGDAVVNANKLVEELNAKIVGLETELNTCKTERDTLKGEKEASENEAKKAEINTYFTTEISKNGFSDEEINSLNHFIDEIDLTGLKSAESELCAKKFKEMLSKKEAEVETNSKEITFIAIHEKEKKVISNENPTFFN